ncbi:hypothetical protein [uncultured Granulicatella sp.]|uniref:hypothetical protein n=1 Tax=uncultured Granulicatella sp. TaxID=316089 RepID=UPI0028D312CF|nr:hypothetical protein [uncultured Granulicatella sp.]
MEQPQNTEKNWVELLQEVKGKVKNLDDAIVNAEKELDTKRDELNVVEDKAADYKTFKKVQKLKEEKEFISNMLVDLKTKRNAVILEMLPEFNRLAVGHLNDDVKVIEEDTKQKAKQYYEEYLDKLTELFDAEDKELNQLQKSNSETKELLFDLFPQHFLQENGFNFLNLEILKYGTVSDQHARMKQELLFDRIF